MKGDVVAVGNTSQVNQLVICLANALNGEPIDLTAPGNNSGLAAANSTNVVVVSYASKSIRKDDLYWNAVQLGKGDGDLMLDPGETFEMTIDLSAVGETIVNYHTFSIEIKPPVGSVLVVERTTPAALANYMILN